MKTSITEEFYGNLITEGISIPILDEERGVGASPEWIEAMKDVVDFIALRVRDTEPDTNRKWSIRVPRSLTKRFDIFYQLDIDVSVEDRGEEAEGYSGGGEFEVYATQQVRKFTSIEGDESYKMWMPSRIFLQGFSNGHSLIRATIYNSFIHELNHAFDEYSRLIKKPGTNSEKIGIFNQSQSLSALKQVILENYDKRMWWIIYRLHSSTEFNALISGVFGDLKGRESVRKNAKVDIKNTTAYFIYKKLVPFVKSIEDNKEEWKDFFKNLQECFSQPEARKVLSPLFPVSKPWDVSEDKFIKAFLDKTKRRLDQLLRGIYRTASYYYDYVDRGVRTSVLDRGEIVHKHTS